MFGPHVDESGEAQEMGKKHSAELNVKVVDYPNMVYVPWSVNVAGAWLKPSI